MSAIWRTLLIKIIIWLVAEIWLGFAGLDDMADFSEYIFEKESVFICQKEEVVLVG